MVAVLISSLALSGGMRPPESQDDALTRLVQTVLNSAPTLTSTVTPSLTSTPTPTETVTPTPTATATATSSPTGTASPSPTGTSTVTPTPTPTSTHTPAPTATATVKPPAVITRYTVKPGDSLYLIATRYNILLQDLVAANNLSSSVIMAGQVLTIPVTGQPPAALQPTTTSVPAGPSGQGKEIQIDISEQRIYAYQEGKLVFNFVASTGIGNSTRIGTFKVLDKIPNAYSNSFNIWMPYWMGIYYSGTLENGIHGLPLLTNGVELWGNLLGKPATYGCIEARTSEIKKLYEWAEIGTPVIIRR